MVPEFFLWQRVKDSNPHIQSQSLLCYLYTNPLCVYLVQRTDIIIQITKKMSTPKFTKFKKIRSFRQRLGTGGYQLLSGGAY